MGFISEDIRAKAIIVHGDEVCRQRSHSLLSEVGLPAGILPARGIIECGYVEETGFVWMKLKRKMEHKFEKIGKVGTLGTEVTGYIEKYRVRKLTGVKVRELMIWFNLAEIHVEDPNSGKITFKVSTGLYRVYPASAFEVEKPKEIKENKNVEENKDVEVVVKETLLV